MKARVWMIALMLVLPLTALLLLRIYESHH
jgi:hypothetical protein